MRNNFSFHLTVIAWIGAVPSIYTVCIFIKFVKGAARVPLLPPRSPPARPDCRHQRGQTSQRVLAASGHTRTRKRYGALAQSVHTLARAHV